MTPGKKSSNKITVVLPVRGLWDCLYWACEHWWPLTCFNDRKKQQNRASFRVYFQESFKSKWEKNKTSFSSIHTVFLLTPEWMKQDFYIHAVHIFPKWKIHDIEYGKVVHLQFSNGFVWPVRMFHSVQLCFWECIVQVVDGHLVEGNHVLEFVQLGKEEPRMKRFR